MHVLQVTWQVGQVRYNHALQRTGLRPAAERDIVGRTTGMSALRIYADFNGLVRGCLNPGSADGMQLRAPPGGIPEYDDKPHGRRLAQR